MPTACCLGRRTVLFAQLVVTLMKCVCVSVSVCVCVCARSLQFLLCVPRFVLNIKLSLRMRAAARSDNVCHYHHSLYVCSNNLTSTLERSEKVFFLSRSDTRVPNSSVGCRRRRRLRKHTYHTQHNAHPPAPRECGKVSTIVDL